VSSIEQDIAGHRARNQSLLRRIEESGVSLTDSRACDIHFFCPDRAAAMCLTADLESELGCEVNANPSNDGWSLEAKKTISPHQLTSSEMTEKLVRLAAQHNSQFDGWGTSI
jgi:hypothetical protein